jgi:hypothetical protein
VTITREDDILVDGRGVKLCRNCFDGNHYFKWGVTKDHAHKGAIVKFFYDQPRGCFSNCMQGECKCPCVDLMKEKPKRVTKREREEYVKQFQGEMF